MVLRQYACHETSLTIRIHFESQGATITGLTSLTTSVVSGMQLVGNDMSDGEVLRVYRAGQGQGWCEMMTESTLASEPLNAFLKLLVETYCRSLTLLVETYCRSHVHSSFRKDPYFHRPIRKQHYQHLRSLFPFRKQHCHDLRSLFPQAVQETALSTLS